MSPVNLPGLRGRNCGIYAVIFSVMAGVILPQFIVRAFIFARLQPFSGVIPHFLDGFTDVKARPLGRTVWF